MIEYSKSDENDEKTSPRALFGLFLRLGATAFGGPLAHIALMQREFVEKRQWFSHQEFVDMIGATNLVPGPNSTEMAMHIGQKRGGWKGLGAAGIAFILPAATLMTILAALYVKFGALPQLQSPLRGLSAVVVAVIAHALWKFGLATLKNATTICAALAALFAAFCGVDELTILFVSALFGVLGGAWRNRKSASGNAQSSNAESGSESENAASVAQSSTRNAAISPRKTPAILLSSAGSGGAIWGVAGAPTLTKIFLIFLKIGAVLYGSGYVLLAFLRQDFVVRSGWMTNRQLLDAVAFGQFTPGPLFTTATFIGYFLGDKYAPRGSIFGGSFGGILGAVAATVGIFLPSFFFVALLSLLLKRVKNSPVLRAFLDMVNAVSLALMAFVTWQLGAAQIGISTVHNSEVIALFVVSLTLLLTTKINSAWLLIGGAFVGFWLHL